MKSLTLTILLALVVSFANAQLDPYKDFTTSDEVTYVTTTKVNSNMISYYLEGLRKTWLVAVKFGRNKVT